MTGDFLDRLNREAYREWIERWQHHRPDPDTFPSGDIFPMGSRRVAARHFIASLPPRAKRRIEISSPAYVQNVRPA
jgi:hypothetical protein